MLKQISRVGLKNSNFSENLTRKIQLTNLIAFFIATFIAIPFIIISILHFPDLIFIPAAGTAICSFAILMNYLRQYSFARVLVSLVPILLATSFQAYLIEPGQAPITGIFAITLAFSLTPLLIFDISESGYFFGLGALNLVIVLMLDTFAGWLNVDYNTAILTEGVFSRLIEFLGVALALTMVLILAFYNKVTEKQVNALFDKMDRRNKEIESSKEELGENLQKLEAAKEKEKQRIWVSEGLSKVNEIIRKYNNGDDELYDHLIATIVHYLKVNQGALYVVKTKESEGSGEERKYIEMVACYAYERKKYISKRIEIGDGLVGQAYLEKDHIYLTEIPQNYVNITSGLGEATPTSILINPLVNNEQVEGILEIASFNELEEYEIDFIKKIGISIASSIYNFSINQKTRRLLEDSQEQTEQLQAQEEEMRQNMEELQATQEEMSRKEKEHLKEIERLHEQHSTNTEKYRQLSLVADNTDNSVIITGANGRIDYVNNGFVQMTGYNLNEVRGKKPGEVLQGKNTSTEAVQRIREKLAKQQPFYEEILNYHKNGNEYWISLAINPVFNEHKELTHYVSIQTNISEAKKRSLNYKYELEAINKANGRIEFDTGGHILNANEQFLELMGYTMEEIEGKHHQIFVKKDEAESEEYRKFWERLGSGEFVTSEFERVNKKGETVWLKGTYSAILDLEGKPYKVIKYAQDITRQKKLEKQLQQHTSELRATEEELRQNIEKMNAAQEKMQRRELELTGLSNALNNTLAVIEFDPEGHILDANSNFTLTTGYDLEEIKSKHHKIFVAAKEAQSAGYRKFWNELREGKAQVGEVRRFTKDKQEVWFSASYTPVVDDENRVIKVIKFAQNITDQKRKAVEQDCKLNALNKTNAVAEFDLEGNVLDANENFLQMLKYGMPEIKGRHHSMFLNGTDPNSKEYKDFWKKLKKGEFIMGEFTRETKEGVEIEIKASYNPVYNLQGQPYKIVEFAQRLN